MVAENANLYYVWGRPQWPRGKGNDMPSSPGNDATPRGGSARSGGPDEAALYIKSAIADLAHMARRHGHDMLGYLLDMAQMEADEIVRRRRGR